ncbi:hypothetical protein MKP08_04750 [Erythrobacter sp. LQ02-29]|uniref:hypothetical protein n=1 Tax=Erythrobacter sp. LQ02-29 TaxID=2920384 RepID=UPI001F4E096E|nr:hypothetical protein [Erythrobacter sp. LQ02-29]MCP9222056.1 hypothetical protein [Erythrobacter sp. LQ02-29]
MTLLIHPGFHKTGTSWLQEEVFTDRRLFHMTLSHEEAFRAIVKPHDFDFDPKAARAVLDRSRSDGRDGLVDVLSSEVLCGTRTTGQRESRTIADRLGAITGPAKILFTVRSQPATLRASYMQFVKRGGRKSFAEFLTFEPEPGYTFFDIRQLAYHHLIEHYGMLYGEENVLVLPQEVLARDPDGFFDALLRFATGQAPPEGVSISRAERAGGSPPASGLPILRFASHFRRSPMDNDPVLPIEPLGAALMSLGYRWKLGNGRATRTLRSQVQDQVGGRFGTSNARMQRFCPFTLAELGYEVEGEVSPRQVTAAG